MASTLGIVTRTQNRPALLPRALRSVAAQTSPHWRLVVVNDAGERVPVEAAVAAVWPQGDARVQVLHRQASCGMEAASNAGIRALGEVDLLTIHDDDDAWAPCFVETMTAAVEAAAPSVAGAVCWTTRVVEQLSADGALREVERHPFNMWLQGITLARMMAENSFPPISLVFRHRVWEALGGFDESLPVLGDWDFNLRLLARWDLELVPQLLAFYHHRVASEGVYANTVTAADDRHRAVESQLRQRWETDAAMPSGWAAFAAGQAQILDRRRALAARGRHSPALPS